MKCIATCALLVVSFGFVAPMNAAVVYDESVSGDLPYDSNHPANVTQLQFLPGSNMLLGNSAGDINSADFDGFSFVVPSGDRLVSASLITTQILPPIPNDFAVINFGFSSIPQPGLSNINAGVPSSGPILTNILPVVPEPTTS